MAWSEVERCLAYAHCQRLGVGAGLMLGVTAGCFGLWTLPFRGYWGILPSLAALLGWGRLKEVVVGWLALCIALAMRYALFDASLGVRYQVPLLKSAVAVMIHAATGAVIGSCFAALVEKQAQGYAVGTALLCQHTEYNPHLLVTGAFTAMLSCLYFVWGDKHEIGFPDKPSGTVALGLEQVKTQAGKSLAGALLVGVVMGLGRPLENDFLQTRLGGAFTWALETGTSSRQHWSDGCHSLALWQTWVMTILCASATLFLNEMGTALLKALIALPLNFHTLAKNAGQKGIIGEALLLHALTLGRETALHALQKAAEAESTEAARVSRPLWQAEVNIQHYSMELVAGNVEGKGWGRVPKVGHFEYHVPLWARLTRVLAAKYLEDHVQLPDLKGKDARGLIYKKAWPDCLRLSLLTLEALNLQLQVYAARASPVQCRLIHGVPNSPEVSFLPEEILASFGLVELWRKQERKQHEVVVPMWRDLKVIRRWLMVQLSVADLHPRLTQAQTEAACSSISALTTLICHAAKEHPTSRCYAFVPVVLNSFLGCLLGIRCFTSCSHPNHIHGNKCDLSPELNLISGCLESAIGKVTEKYEGSMGSFSFPDAYAELLKNYCPKCS